VDDRFRHRDRPPLLPDDRHRRFVQLGKVPAGKSRSGWHSRYSLKTATVTVEPNKTAEAKFSYDGTEKAE
jgi:hypothetical protein